MPTHIPPEILEEIIQYILQTDEAQCANTTGENSKPDWKLLESFTLTCWKFRMLAMPAWFRTLYLKSVYDAQAIAVEFLSHLHCVYSRDEHDRNVGWDLSGFKRLNSIRLDWGTSSPPFPMENPKVVPFINVDSLITELDVRGVRYPSPMLIQSLVGPFQHLVILKLESLRTWCGLCHTCTLIRFPSPNPAGFLYEGGLGLSVHYSRSLYSLKNLEEVVLTLPDVGNGIMSSGFSSQSEDNMWTGECDRCMALMYDYLAFKKGWMAKKRGLNIDGVSQSSVYEKPPSLKKVQWNLWTWDSAESTRTYSQEEIDMDDETVIDGMTIEASDVEGEVSDA